MKKILLSIATALALTTGVLVATALPANALTCNWSAISWKTGGSTWGAGKFCGGSSTFQVQTDDRQHDGYCVHAEAYDYMPWGVYDWVYAANSESCGDVRTSTIYTNGAVKEVRLVRGDPTGCIPNGNCNGVGYNYFTLIKFNLG